MKFRFGTVFLSLFSIYSSQVWADSTSPIYLSGNGSVGYSGASVASGVSNPTILQFSVGGTGAYHLTSSFMAGVSSDFTFINQYSDPANSGGNYRGTRWNIISPTLGFMFGNLTFLGDFEFLGNYNLYASAANGGTVSFSSPLGGRLRVTVPVHEKINAGLGFEYLTFGTRKNSVSGDAPLDSKQTLWQIAAVISYIF